MDYNEMVPDWDADDLPQRAVLDARLADMLAQHLDEDRLWSQTVTTLASDLVEADQVRKMLTRFCCVAGNLAIYCHGGRAEAVAALRGQVEELRVIVARGSAQ